MNRSFFFQGRERKAAFIRPLPPPAEIVRGPRLLLASPFHHTLVFMSGRSNSSCNSHSG